MGNTFRRFILTLALVAVTAVGAQAQITIGGNVFGGGRMADVKGNTNVNVSGQQGDSKQTYLNGVFGGNDIAGQVAIGQDKTGSTIVIGKNGKSNEIHISEVYGGGNGYYQYGSTPVSASEQTVMPSGSTTAVKNYDGTGDVIVELEAGKYVPTIPTTHITIYGGKTFINEMFGGAKNAYITKAYCDNAVDIDITNGVMGKVFGGNNYGGYIHGNIDIDVTGTVEPSSKTAASNYYAKVGRVESTTEGVKTYYTDGFGIAELYGGGNRVPAPGNVDISVTGGMIDMCFAGGNSATVGGYESCNSATTSTSVTVNATPIYAAGTGFDGESGVYNIRTLFGGNNQAAMGVLPTLTLTQGGIGTVYGGGNAGSMTANVSGKSTDIQLTSTQVVKVDVLYGGCKAANVSAGTNINLASESATVGIIYGGCNVSGSVAGDSYVTLENGKVEKAVFGGANGDYGCNDGATYTSNIKAPATAGMAIPTIKSTHVYVEGATIGAEGATANIYGGGNMAPVGSSSQPGSTEVKLDNGIVYGSAFGGGNMASVYGVANIYTPDNSTITITNVFGGNDKSGGVSGAIPSESTRSLFASATDNTSLSQTTAASYVRLEGSPTITSVYGGGNGDYDYTNTTLFTCGQSAPVQTSSFVDVKTTNTNTIQTVYGGGNAAAISGNTTVLMNTGVVATTYGGCKAANVGGVATTNLKGGSVTTVYGGNDYAGTVRQAAVNLTGSTVGNIYGAGNGNYTYTDGAARPVAKTTTVTLDGGQVTQDVYGGGLAGDVEGNTSVVVRSTTELASTSTIYGGGCGNVSAIGLCNDKVGNVTGTAYLTIEGLKADVNAIYGGGRNGNVVNTNVSVANTVNHKIGTLYGGCMASNLTGTATITLGSEGEDGEWPKITTVYGGNDFSGLTNKTVMTIHSGTYTNVFGAGNGVYDYWKDSRYEKCDTVPYSMDVNLTFNGGTYTSHVYGGGNMGLVGDKAITSTSYPEGYQSQVADRYGYIHMTIHGGEFQNRVFAGASGTAIGNKRFFGLGSTAVDGQGRKSTVLAYAYKQVDMDGGHIRFSLHGGSEGVDDGYPYECWDTPKDKTSEHPSTVVNIVGGTIEKSVYGGGYEGSTYGSVFVNVGVNAVHNCPVWTMTFGRYASADATDRIAGKSWSFHSLDKMNYYESQARMLTKSALYLRASVYNGNDWGEAGRSQYFDTRGFYGGRGLVYIDGLGYQTSRTVASTYPQMEISNSLFGSGTSTAPADISSRIWVYNYGDYSCPHPSRNFFSIQRTDTLLLYNSYFRLSGESDAYYAHTSNVRSLNRVGVVVMHDHNLVETDAPSEYIGKIISEKFEGNGDGVNHLYGAAELAAKSKQGCADEFAANPCDLLYGDVISTNTMVLNGGAYLTVRPFKDVKNNETNALIPDHIDDEDGEYGPICGYLFVSAEQSTLASVTSRIKNAKTNASDGGFVSPCSSSNVTDTDKGYTSERVYINMVNTGGTDAPHRSWSVGVDGGNRARKITLVAHADPSRVDENKPISDFSLGSGENKKEYENFAYTTASLVLPPSNGGNYYQITSVTIDDDNGGQVDLMDWAYNEAKVTTTDSTSDPATTTTREIGWWSPWCSSNCEANEMTDLNSIVANPSYTFGLMFKLGKYFGTASEANRKDKTVISGNNSLVQGNGFVSNSIVDSAVGVLPTINFTLVYNTKMETTIARDVVFTLDEYKSDGNRVGPVEITVTISTIISDFEDMAPTVLAMYNEGLYSDYTRKVVIPASFEERDLYIDGIEWKYSNDSVDIHLQDSSVAINDYSHFGLAFAPSQRVTDNISNSLGWYDIHTAKLDIYDLKDAQGVYKSNKGDANQTQNPSSTDNNLSTLWFNEPILLGTLDGRATAAFDVRLKYNGHLMYKDIDDLARVVLHCRYVNKKEVDDGSGNKIFPTGTFKVNIKIWTRLKGDTIYMAEPAMLTIHKDGHVTEHTSASTTIMKSGETGYDASVVSAMYRFDNDQMDSYKKNDPIVYVDNFKKALHSKVYKEGDVLCIMGPIHINNPDNPFGIQGSNYSYINICRYAGSHPRLPGEDHTYRGPLMIVENGSKLTISNARINGNGCSRLSTYSEVTLANAPEKWDNLSTNQETIHPIMDNRENPFTLATANGQEIYFKYTDASSNVYRKYEFKDRNSAKDTTFAHAPIFVVKDGSQLRLNTNVKILNNFNVYDAEAADTVNTNELFSQGGAIYMEKTQNGSPVVAIGDMVYFEDNMVINGKHDHPASACTTAGGGTYTYYTPGNKGAAIYVNGGSLELGTSKESDIQIKQNYYLSATDYSSQTQTQTLLDKLFVIETLSYRNPSVTSGGDVQYDIYKPKTDNLTRCEASNVYLTRTTPATDNAAQKITTDGDRTSLITVKKELASKSRIGVSKWFPGYKWRDNCTGRDTVVIASYNDALAAQQNFTDGVWIDDSCSIESGSHYHIYNDGSTGKRDEVNLLYSTLLNYYNVYLQRCATFSVANNPLAWNMDESVICPGDGDKITFKVEGGVPAYTYNWYVKNDGEGFADSDVPTYSSVSTQKEGSYVPLNLTIPAGVSDKTFKFKVVATDAGGGLCKAEHYFDVHLVQTGSDDASADPTVAGKVKYYSESKTAKSQSLDTWLGNTGIEGNYNSSSDWNVSSNATAFAVPGSVMNSNPVGNADTPKKVVRTYTYRKLDWSVSPLAECGEITPPEGITTSSRLCPGDVVALNVAPASGYEFMMWDYDPSAGQELDIVVGNTDVQSVKAYMSPSSYWWQTVTSASESLNSSPSVADTTSFYMDYHGNCHIYDEKGLAWFISVTNGLNYQQQRTFIHDTIYIHDASHSGTDNYNMSAHKWTPVGNIRLPFRGTVIADENVKISGIIVNEPDMEYVGFFGQTDSARINHLTLQNSTIKGNQFGGGLVGYAGKDSEIHTVKLGDITVSAANMVGGMAGKSDNSWYWGNTIGYAEHPIMLVGSSLYAGGIAGTAQEVTTGQSHYGEEVPEASKNNSVSVDATNLSALYVGGAFGITTKPTQITSKKGRRGAKSDGEDPIRIHNNYIRFISGERSLYAGGLVASASHSDMQNNYVYGEVGSISSNGSLIARVGDGVSVENCYFQEGSNTSAFGSTTPDATSDVTTFSGEGNQVKLAERVAGIDNMTRVLNNWVRGREDADFYTWRSDLDGANNGYPIFGEPDRIPVFDTVHEVVCDSMNLDGIILTESGIYKTIYAKSAEYVDSILTIVLTVNHSESIEYADTINLGEGYEGNGFSLTPDQIAQMELLYARGDVRVLQFVDSLLTEQGCDSLIILNLAVYAGSDLGVDDNVRFDVKVYPNPTVGLVNVEADNLKTVEVYDAISRNVLKKEGVDGKAAFDLTPLASGSYYLRIVTEQGTVVRKVVKK